MLFRNPHYSCNVILNKNFLISGCRNHCNSQFMKLNLMDFVAVWFNSLGRNDYTKLQSAKFTPRILVSWFSPLGPGSGAGKGGGGGGSVRESGGGLGQFGAVQEDQFFYNQQREQLKNIKKKLKEVPTAKTGDITRKEEK